LGNFLDKLSVRQMVKEDLDSIVDIDTRVLGETRKDYWIIKIGEVSGWEFKVPNNIGWIDTIGIDPDYQNRGIAKVLAMALITNLKQHGVDTIYTLVNWNDWDLLQFFHAMGFSRGDMINLVLKV
jgi:N-acetylglutamate synthase-like GNAT family acetyltransferase